MDKNTINIPGWRIIRTIGKGSFGCVYEVEKEDEFGGVAPSALKVISIPERDTEVEEYRQEGYDDKSLTELFKSQVEDITSEFRLMSKLKGCSNIVSFEDHSIVQHTDDPGYDIYIRMELLTTLMKAYEQELAENGFTDRYVQRVGVDICRALELCGRFSIIHRDIKPQNIFVNELGDFKLGDFGIAKTSDHTTRATKTGTYNYMAPEVYWGKPYNASVDLYSLGLVLYWMMNERRGPFLPLPPALPKPAQNAEAMDRRMHGEALPAPKNGSDELRRIVLKACAYDPKDRYASPAEMRRDLERAAAAREAETTAASIRPAAPAYAEADEQTIGVFRKETETDRTVSVISEPVRAGEPERPAPVAAQAPAAGEIRTPQPKEANEATVGVFRAQTGKSVDTYGDGTVRVAAEPVRRNEPVPDDEDEDATVGLFAKKPPVKKEPEKKPEPKAEQPKPAPQPAEKPENPAEKPKPDKSAKPEKPSGRGSKKKLAVIAAAAALAVIAAVVLIVVLAGKGKPAQQAEIQPTEAPTTVPTVAPTENPVVVFQNAAFEKAFRDKYHLTGTIYQSDILAFDHLDLSGQDLTDISDVAQFRNLKSLRLGWSPRVNRYNHISDISALSVLTNLSVLNLYGNQISDISALSGLTNLIKLDLDYNNISDISALSGLSKLQSLSLGYNQIRVITELNGLTNLTHLWLANNPLSRQQINELKTKLPNCKIYN